MSVQQGRIGGRSLQLAVGEILISVRDALVGF
jgi:hypothetical protein